MNKNKEKIILNADGKTPKYKITYANGKISHWRKFYDNGNKKSEIKYENGEVKDFFEYSEQGTLEDAWDMINNGVHSVMRKRSLFSAASIKGKA